MKEQELVRETDMRQLVHRTKTTMRQNMGERDGSALTDDVLRTIVTNRLEGLVPLAHRAIYDDPRFPCMTVLVRLGISFPGYHEKRKGHESLLSVEILRLSLYHRVFSSEP
jgi:hypothetical protein